MCEQSCVVCGGPGEAHEFGEAWCADHFVAVWAAVHEARCRGEALNVSAWLRLERWAWRAFEAERQRARD